MKTAPEMTYTVSGGALHSAQSNLTSVTLYIVSLKLCNVTVLVKNEILSCYIGYAESL